MVTLITSYVHKFLEGYGYMSINEFIMSLCPSFKYNLQTPTLAISAILAVLSHYLGVGVLIISAMFVAVLVETFTGIQASRKKGIAFESFRFSRCILKVFIWMSLVFITNCFALECKMGEEWYNYMGAWFFDTVRMMILSYFVVEYVISILENFAVIDGKPKTTFIDALEVLWRSFLRKMRNKDNDNIDYYYDDNRREY